MVKWPQTFLSPLFGHRILKLKTTFGSQLSTAFPQSSENKSWEKSIEVLDKYINVLRMCPLPSSKLLLLYAVPGLSFLPHVTHSPHPLDQRDLAAAKPQGHKWLLRACMVKGWVRVSVSSHFYKTPFGSRPEGLGEPPCRYRGETFPGDQRPRQGPPGLLKRGHRAGSAASRGHSGDQRERNSWGWIM